MKVKVRLLVTLAGSSGALSGNAGDEREVDESLARKFLDGGLLELVEPADDDEAKPRKAK